VDEKKTKLEKTQPSCDEKKQVGKRRRKASPWFYFQKVPYFPGPLREKEIRRRRKGGKIKLNLQKGLKIGDQKTTVKAPRQKKRGESPRARKSGALPPVKITFCFLFVCFLGGWGGGFFFFPPARLVGGVGWFSTKPFFWFGQVVEVWVGGDSAQPTNAHAHRRDTNGKTEATAKRGSRKKTKRELNTPPSRKEEKQRKWWEKRHAAERWDRNHNEKKDVGRQ